MNDMTHLHPLYTDIPAPERFTFPFCYEPHPLCLLAAGETQRHIRSEQCWQEEIARGKMFGVLVVSDGCRLGYLAAYSGLLAGRNDWPFFVPPVYDLLRPGGYFKSREDEITAVNRQVEALENSPLRRRAEETLAAVRQEAALAVGDYRRKMDEAKRRRDEVRRLGGGTGADGERLVRESQFMKAELRRIKKKYAGLTAEAEARLRAVEAEAEALRQRRKKMSDGLQQWLFGQFRMLNARGERRDLCDIFASTAGRVPPAGAGECCAPKLLQYAYSHGLRPVCMAEFWWGASPKTELRRHLHYYPACRGKCKPILEHMLQGLDVDPDPLAGNSGGQVEVVYDDPWIAVVCKPAGMLSVPGAGDSASVQSALRGMFPGAGGPLTVHRLDMDTSGLMVVAKTAEAHRRLQAQFGERTVRKRYVALLQGEIPPCSGTISLPIRPDPLDRPRQVVDTLHGRAAVTAYRTAGVSGGHTRVELWPLTGRTHQLRVHCAHPDGLDMPILGDPLYGVRSARMCLHAEMIEFDHPADGRRMRFTREADF